MDNEIELSEQIDYKLGSTSEDIVVTTSEENQKFSIELASQASKTIDIYTQDLAARIYDVPEFISALRDLVVRNHSATIRVLVVDPDKTIKNGHRIVELSRRLTSSVELRHVATDFRSDPQSFLVVDGRGVLHSKDGNRFEAVVNFNDPLQGRELLNHFDTIWEHSPIVMDFRRLHV